MNTLRRIIRCVRTVPRFRVLAFLAALLLTLQITALLAQETGQGQGRNSQPGELQRDPKPDDQTGGASMGEPNPSAANTGGGRMNETPQRGPGDLQPPVDLNKRQARGRQTDRKPEEAPAGSHLHLRILIDEEGSADLVSATEVPGEPVLSDNITGDLVYEVARGDEVLAVQTLPDPFELRSFPRAGGETEEHHFERARSAAILVKVPRAGLESADLDSLTLRLYQMLPGGAVERLDAQTLDALRRERRLQVKLEVPGSVLGPQIRRKGRRL